MELLKDLAALPPIEYGGVGAAKPAAKLQQKNVIKSGIDRKGGRKFAVNTDIPTSTLPSSSSAMSIDSPLSRNANLPIRPSSSLTSSGTLAASSTNGFTDTFRKKTSSAKLYTLMGESASSPSLSPFQPYGDRPNTSAVTTSSSLSGFAAPSDKLTALSGADLGAARPATASTPPSYSRKLSRGSGDGGDPTTADMLLPLPLTTDEDSILELSGPSGYDSSTSEENARLKAEVERLKTAYVSKLRGNGKFVGGAQFRAGKANMSSNPTSLGAGGKGGKLQCQNCLTSKSALSKVKTDLRESKQRGKIAEDEVSKLTYRISSLEREVADLLKQFQLSQGTLEEKDGYVRDATSRAESDASTIKALETELAMKEMLMLQMRSSSGDSVATLKNQLRSVLDTASKGSHIEAELQRISRERDDALKALQALQLESEALQLKLATQLVEFEAVKISKHQSEVALGKEIEGLSMRLASAVELTNLRAEEVQQSRVQAACLSKEKVEIQEALQSFTAKAAMNMKNDASTILSLRESVALLQSKKASEEDGLDLVIKRLQDEIVSLKREARESRAAAESRAAKAENKITELTASLTNLSEQHSGCGGHVGTLEEKCLSLLSSVRVAQEAEAMARAGEIKVASEMEKLKIETASKIEAALQRVMSCTADAETAKGAAEDAAKACKLASNRSMFLEGENCDLKAALEEAESKIERMEEARAKALEMTLQSMVRLCVVAPTVNVHLGDVITDCKGGLPSKKVKKLIEGKILPDFTDVFVQPEEGRGPDGRPMDEWLEGLAHEMQGSIEEHLKSVFRS